MIYILNPRTNLCELGRSQVSIGDTIIEGPLETSFRSRPARVGRKATIDRDQIGDWKLRERERERPWRYSRVEDARNANTLSLSRLSHSPRAGLGLGLGCNTQLGDLLNSVQQRGESRGAYFPDATFDSNMTLTSPQSGVSPPGDPGPQGRMRPSQLEAVAESKERALRLGAPVGVADCTLANNEVAFLDHGEEERITLQQLTSNSGDTYATTHDLFKGTRTVATTEPPDERLPQPVRFLADRAEDVLRTLPVVAHPPRISGFDTHAVAGEGTAFVSDTAKSTTGHQSCLRRAAEPLPSNFFAAIHATHVAPARVDYLPWIPNLPQARPVGRIKPRPAADDWLAVGFDPWSAGKEPLVSEFVASLSAKADTIVEGGQLTVPSQQQQGSVASSQLDESFIDILDRRGLAHAQQEAAHAQKQSEDFDQLASWARHNKYREIEDAINQPDWTLPIDYQDFLGNTLLSVAVQNGNKRIAKLTLRRGANINLANNTGQTVLHYAYAYGNEEMAEYLKSKGADDRPTNADGLTCYEGLALDGIEQM